jgi:hypothetical protein
VIEADDVVEGVAPEGDLLQDERVGAHVGNEGAPGTREPRRW